MRSQLQRLIASVMRHIAQDENASEKNRNWFTVSMTSDSRCQVELLIGMRDQRSRIHLHPVQYVSPNRHESLCRALISWCPALGTQVAL